MYILSLGSLIEKLFRNIFFLIDSVVYNMIPKIYNLLITIAKTSPLSQADIADMASRVYKLLAVFMIFKVTFSLIMYVVNPDDFSDKSKGVSKLITNIVISLGMLVLTPYIFSLAYQFQEIILTKNTLGTVIFGDMDAENSTIIDSAGEQMAYIAIRPFITPNLDYFDCAQPYYTTVGTDNKKKNVLSKACFGFEDVNSINDSNASCDPNAASNSEQKVLCDAAEATGSTDKYLTQEIVDNYALGLQYGSHNLLLRRNTVTAYVKTKDNKAEDFAFDYVFGISTVVGIIILLFLISTCMDVGLRSIKLAFLQLIAPIPILSYVDPKSGKDGMFKKWYQMAFKTYLSLFVRILALYFAIYIIGKIGRLVDVIDGSYVSSCLVEIFIIIGALMFAKNFIKILEALGIKFDGDFQLLPIKKFKDQALGGKQLVGAAGAVGAAALAGGVNAVHRLGNTAGAMRAAWKKVDYDSEGNVTDTPRNVKIGRTAKAGVSGLARATGSSIAGFASAGTRGLKKAGKGEGFFKTFGDSYGEAMFAKKQREDLQRKVGAKTMKDRVVFTAKSTAADVERWMGIFNAGQRQEIKLATVDAEYESRRRTQKKLKEDNERAQQALVVDKNEKIKQIQRRKDNLSTIMSTIATSKFNYFNEDEGKTISINVKDREENVKQMQERGEFYAKVGDAIHKDVKKGETYLKDVKKGETYYTDIKAGYKFKDPTTGNFVIATEDMKGVAVQADEDMKGVSVIAQDDMTNVATIATQDDVNNLVLTDAGKQADTDLKEERKEALKALKLIDGDTQDRIEELKQLLPGKLAAEDYYDPVTKEKRKRTQEEIAADMEKILSDPSMIKTYIGISTRDEAAVNTSYAKRERELQEEKNNIDLELKTIEDEYKKAIESQHLDKTSREWIVNEAANASRGVKNKEPEGFKISPTVDTTAYTPFVTNVQQGNATVTPPTPAPPPGGPAPGGPAPGGS